ncbi:hypothetical protein CEXT_164881 [Caerostris extrusa]|uniref:Uncharacterized protein n=1 Tax=Caerostris extrusa TaxID=172846 RepID=A0AAV4YEJ4_CAEEX|nr:hypothetical protein CEXT_164881 [Caerostris extrusa]
MIVLFLQLWIYISVFRSRTKIRLLTEELHRISNMLYAYTLQEKKIFKVYIWVYCLFVTFLAISLEVTLFQFWDDSSRAVQTAEFRINSCTLKKSIQ